MSCGILWIRMGCATSTDGGITGQHIAFGYCCCCCCLSLWSWKNLAATQYSLPVTCYFCCFLLFFRALSAVWSDWRKNDEWTRDFWAENKEKWWGKNETKQWHLVELNRNYHHKLICQQVKTGVLSGIFLVAACTKTSRNQLSEVKLT